MRRLAGLCSTTLIHHSLTDCIPLKAQHANTISSTAGHLTSTSLTRLHANSITANAAPLTNTSVIELEILRLYRKHTLSLVRQSATLLCRCYFCCSVANVSICLRRCWMPLKRKLFWSVSALPTLDRSVRLNTQAPTMGAIQIRLWFHISQRQYTTRMIFN